MLTRLGLNPDRVLFMSQVAEHCTAEERAAFVAKSNTMQGLVAKAFFEAGKKPAFLDFARQTIIEDDYKFMWLGDQHVTMRHTETSDVIKVVRQHYIDTTGFESLEHAKQTIELNYATASTFIGKFLTPQVVSIEKQPYKRTNELGVMIRQPFVDGESPSLEVPRSQTVQTQLKDLINSSQALYEETGILPDLNTINLIIKDSDVKLVDTSFHQVEAAIPNKANNFRKKAYTESFARLQEVAA